MRCFRAVMCALGLACLGPAARGGDAAVRGRPSPEALRHFTPEEIERGASRARESRLLWLASLAWSLIVLAGLSHPRVGAAFVAAARRIARAGEAGSSWRAHLAAVLSVAMILGAYFILRKPFAWARGHWFEHRWGLSTQGAAAFLWDWVRAALITTLLYTVALAAIVILRAHMPCWWPLAAWGAVATFIVLMVFLHPVVIDPVFNRFTPVEEPELRSRAEAVARRAGIEVGDILWVDASRRTKRTNAYFTGLGATKRIVLYDTLRADDGSIPPKRLDEVATILAHEAGHWRHGHMWKGTLLGAGGVAGFLVFLWLLLGSGWGWVPPAALPGGARAAALVLLAATAVSFLVMPVQNAISRSMERSADRASLELTRDPEAFIRAEVELARKNVSDIEPGRLAVFWLYTHPPVMERIGMAEEFRREPQMNADERSSNGRPPAGRH